METPQPVLLLLLSVIRTHTSTKMVAPHQRAPLHPRLQTQPPNTTGPSHNILQRPAKFSVTLAPRLSTSRGQGSAHPLGAQCSTAPPIAPPTVSDSDVDDLQLEAMLSLGLERDDTCIMPSSSLWMVPSVRFYASSFVREQQQHSQASGECHHWVLHCLGHIDGDRFGVKRANTVLPHVLPLMDAEEQQDDEGSALPLHLQASPRKRPRCHDDISCLNLPVPCTAFQKPPQQHPEGYRRTNRGEETMDEAAFFTSPLLEAAC